MRLYRMLLVLLALATLGAPLELDAQRRSSRSSSGRVHVRGYTRRDGSHVAPHTRSAPHSRGYSAPRSRSPRSYAVPSPRARSYSAPRQPRTYTAPRAHRTPSARPYRAPPSRSRAYAPTQPRDSRGRFTRSRSARSDFMRSTGYSRGRPGYVVDHVVPLCAGGADAPSNMQWQTVDEAKIKDRQERATCARRRP